MSKEKKKSKKAKAAKGRPRLYSVICPVSMRRDQADAIDAFIANPKRVLQYPSRAEFFRRAAVYFIDKHA